MIVLFFLQALVLIVVIRRCARLLLSLIASSVGCEPRVGTALERALASDPSATVRTLGATADGAWLGELAALRAGGADDDALAEQVDVWRGDLREELYVLGGIGRLASVATMMCAVIQLSWGLMGGTGLVALQAGLPQQLAFRDALTSLALGFVTLGLYAWTRVEARRISLERFKAIATLARSLGASST